MAEIVVGVIGVLITGLLGGEFCSTGRRVLAWWGIKSNLFLEILVGILCWTLLGFLLLALGVVLWQLMPH